MQDAFAHCQALVRTADKDRFLATLFAPARHRAGLFALYAFNIEVSRLREIVRQPLAGEIRLQWWQEALAGERTGEVAANPVAKALVETVARYGLAVAQLRAILEGRRFDLYDEPMVTLPDLYAYVDQVSTTLVLLAAQILGAGHLVNIDAIARPASRADTMCGVLRAFLIHAARGQLYVPFEVLQRHGADRPTVSDRAATPALRAALAEFRIMARRQLVEAGEAASALAPDVVPVLLPIALVRPRLDRMERAQDDPFVVAELPPWRRQWLIWRAAHRPARIFA
jgi:phytoene synthase